MSDYLFISDLHLSPERPEIISLFLKFMDEVAPSTKSLYILGDFLEYWIGDDMELAIQDTPIADAFNAIKTLASKGTKIYLMHGNRDFLIGNQLADKYQFKLISDPTTINVNHTPILLMHGDTLCTDDIEYLNFRGMVRDASWQQTFLSKSLNEREKIAKDLREKSKEAIADKKPDIMDVNQNAVIDAMVQNNVSTLIHGHTHRPALHDFVYEGNDMKRYVLADWYDSGSYLEITGFDFKVYNFN